ncbi:hypothetical protein D3C80_1973960 [compost metagenome]
MRVGHQTHVAGTLQLGQGANRRGQLHAVVGGLGFAAPEFLFHALENHQGAPATDAGIALAGTIGVNLDLFIHAEPISQ